MYIGFVGACDLHMCDIYVYIPGACDMDLHVQVMKVCRYGNALCVCFPYSNGPLYLYNS